MWRTRLLCEVVAYVVCRMTECMGGWMVGWRVIPLSIFVRQACRGLFAKGERTCSEGNSCKMLKLAIFETVISACPISLP